MVYGPGDHTRISPYLKIMDDNQPIFLDEEKANWRFSRGYVEDIANGIVAAALDSRPDNRIYNIGETVAYTEKQWIQLIGTVAGWKNNLITLPKDKLPEHLREDLAWEQDLIIDTSLIRKELNYKTLFSSEEAFKKSIDWIRGQA
jgi:nucleoside-diphosphate-sugar epimerase